MGLVYASLLAIVPLLAFSFGILKGFDAQGVLRAAGARILPADGRRGRRTDRRRSWTSPTTCAAAWSARSGLALLIWTLIGTLKKVEDAFNFVWHVEVPRSFVRRIAEYVALLVVAPMLIGALVGIAHDHLGEQLGAACSRTCRCWSRWGMGCLRSRRWRSSAASSRVVYALVPNTRVRLVPALIGGIAAGIAWAVVGQIFTAFVLLSTRLTIVYAGFAIIIAALIWIYFGWMILLLGAQLSFYVQNPSYLRVGLREPRLSNAETEQLALSIMYLVARSHLHGGKRWSIGALAAELALPGVAVTRSIDALEAAGLLVTTDKETLLPARDAGYIPLTEIVSVARAAYSVHGDDRYVAPKPVAKLYAEFEAAWRGKLGTRTLEAWVVETS